MVKISNVKLISSIIESIQKVTQGLGSVFDTSGKVVLMVKPDKASTKTLHDIDSGPPLYLHPHTHHRL